MMRRVQRIQQLGRMGWHRNLNCLHASAKATSAHVFADDGEQFATTGLSPEVIASLEKVGLVRPTKIQLAGIPAILSGVNTVLASETGSGKTIAYLAPLVHMLRSLAVDDLYKPSALVLAPTQELVLQVTAVARQCFPWMADAIRPTYGAVGPRNKELCSLLIATPKALRENIGQSRLRLLRTVVLDEADLLLTGEYADDVTEWLIEGRQNNSAKRKANRTRSRIAQTVFCGATVPDAGTSGARAFIERTFPDAHWVTAGVQHSMQERTIHRYCSIEVDEDLYGDERALRTLREGVGGLMQAAGDDAQADSNSESDSDSDSNSGFQLPAGVDALQFMARRDSLRADRADCLQAAKLRILPIALAAEPGAALGALDGRDHLEPMLGVSISTMLGEKSKQRSEAEATNAFADADANVDIDVDETADLTAPEDMETVKEPPGVQIDRDDLLKVSDEIRLPTVTAKARSRKSGKPGNKRKGGGEASMQIQVKGGTAVREAPMLTPIDTVSMPQTLVFCNTVASANAALRQIRQSAPHLPVVVLHKKIGQERRQTAVARFLSGEAKVLVSTDIAARGLDTTAVGHVIQLDFAPSAVSFLHRIGRTGRLGQPGRVTSLVTPEDAPLARGIVAAQALGLSLDPVFSRRRSLRRRRKRLAAREDELNQGVGVMDQEIQSITEASARQ